MVNVGGLRIGGISGKTKIYYLGSVVVINVGGLRIRGISIIIF